jgi:hypothetical protein
MIGLMQDKPSIKKRIHNEQIKRERNRKLQGALEDFHEILPMSNVRYSCECDRSSCRAIIEMAGNTYQSLHRNPNRCVVKPGHEHLDIETVVDKYYGFLVVEKTTS